MKRTTIIGIAFATYVVAMIGMFFGVEKYIESKDNRLRREMHDKIDELFQGRKQYVDVAYSGYKVGYEKVHCLSHQKTLLMLIQQDSWVVYLKKLAMNMRITMVS